MRTKTCVWMALCMITGLSVALMILAIFYYDYDVMDKRNQDDDLLKILKTSKKSMMLFYSLEDFNDVLRNNWETFRKKIYDSNGAKGVYLGKVECSVFRSTCEGFDLYIYPTIVWMEKGKIIEQYVGDERVESINAFFIKHAPNITRIILNNNATSKTPANELDINSRFIENEKKSPNTSGIIENDDQEMTFASTTNGKLDIFPIKVKDQENQANKTAVNKTNLEIPKIITKAPKGEISVESNGNSNNTGIFIEKLHPLRDDKSIVENQESTKQQTNKSSDSFEGLPMVKPVQTPVKEENKNKAAKEEEEEDEDEEESMEYYDSFSNEQNVRGESDEYESPDNTEGGNLNIGEMFRSVSEEDERRINEKSDEEKQNTDKKENSVEYEEDDSADDDDDDDERKIMDKKPKIKSAPIKKSKPSKSKERIRDKKLLSSSDNAKKSQKSKSVEATEKNKKLKSDESTNKEEKLKERINKDKNQNIKSEETDKQNSKKSDEVKNRKTISDDNDKKGQKQKSIEAERKSDEIKSRVVTQKSYKSQSLEEQKDEDETPKPDSKKYSATRKYKN